jgi:broad specificity phosphatase PhoE
MTTTIYLLRHGATAANIADPPILQGRGMDLPLSETGVAQVQKAAIALQGVRLSAVYASPLLRARESAQIVAGPHRLEIKTHDFLTEVDVGQWEGRSWGEIRVTDAEAYRQFQNDPGQYGYLGGETMTQVYERVKPAFDEIAAAHSGQTIAIVAHNVVNRAYLAGVLGLPMSRARNIVQGNACINVLHISPSETTVVTVNSALHLEL